MFTVSLLSGRLNADLLGFLGEMVNVRLLPWLHSFALLPAVHEMPVSLHLHQS